MEDRLPVQPNAGLEREQIPFAAVCRSIVDRGPAQVIAADSSPPRPPTH